MKIELYGITVPAKYEVCYRCEGRGVHDCWEGGMTGEEMEEQGPEFFEDYMNGVYSTKCTVCNGDRVVAVIDRDRCTPEELAAHDEAQEAHNAYEAECAAEARYFGRFG